MTATGLGFIFYGMSEDRFQSLNDKMDELIESYIQAQRENRALRANERSWQDERQLLLEKNRDTKTCLQSILQRLKALDMDNPS